jgi:hypothetical protein
MARQKPVKYTSSEVHWALIAKCSDKNDHPERYEDGYTPKQALFCPYYANVRGVLGSDWGVIVNPASDRFGLMTFEHDHCGCPDNFHEEGNQQDDEWHDHARARKNMEAKYPKLKKRKAS